MTDNADWKSKCTFLNPQTAGVEVDINGQTVRFFPVSVGKLFELRAIAQPLATALMTLLGNNDADSGLHRTTKEEGGLEETVMPPSPEVIEVRKRHQAEAIKELTDALTDPKNLALVGGVLIDSLREVFPPGSPDNPPGGEFIKSVHAVDLPKLIKGLAAANKGVLGDFGGKATGLLDNVFEKVKAKADENVKKEKKEQQNKRSEEQNSKQDATG